MLDATGLGVTLAIRNIDVKLTAENVEQILDGYGLGGTYTSVMLPLDCNYISNCGYALVRFVNASDALACYDMCSGKVFGSEYAPPGFEVSGKPCWLEVTGDDGGFAPEPRDLDQLRLASDSSDFDAVHRPKQQAPKILSTTYQTSQSASTSSSCDAPQLAPTFKEMMGLLPPAQHRPQGLRSLLRRYGIPRAPPPAGKA